MSNTVSDDLVSAALGLARERNQGVADVPLTAIAAAAGISRSTLLRRLGGTRRALDEAVQSAGIDPGGRPPVRERAIEAAGRLISERGLATVTLEAVASEAGCSLPSLHAVFEGRDGLLAAVFERFSPVRDLELLMADRPDDLRETVRGCYRALIAAVGQEPNVMPALVADLFGNPHGPARPVWEREVLPRMLASVGAWLTDETEAGRIRPLPLPLLVQLLISPLAVHMITRPLLESVWGSDYPTVDEAAATFADSFLRAVAQPDAAPTHERPVDAGATTGAERKG